MAELRVSAALQNLEDVIAFVNTQLHAADCPGSIQNKIDLAVEEVFANIARYAYDSEVGDVVIRCEVDQAAREAIVVFSDTGKPYNPLLARQPDISLSAQDRPIGGLGIFLVRQLMDCVSYAFQSGQNTLTLRKSWNK